MASNSYEIVSMNLNGSRQHFQARVHLEPSTAGDRLLVDGSDQTDADWSPESRDNHLAALADWLAEDDPER